MKSDDGGGVVKKTFHLQRGREAAGNHGGLGDGVHSHGVWWGQRRTDDHGGSHAQGGVHQHQGAGHGGDCGDDKEHGQADHRRKLGANDRPAGTARECPQQGWEENRQDHVAGHVQAGEPWHEDGARDHHGQQSGPR